jgi:hypothetical protein
MIGAVGISESELTSVQGPGKPQDQGRLHPWNAVQIQSILKKRSEPRKSNRGGV